MLGNDSLRPDLNEMILRFIIRRRISCYKIFEYNPDNIFYDLK